MAAIEGRAANLRSLLEDEIVRVKSVYMRDLDLEVSPAVAAGVPSRSWLELGGVVSGCFNPNESSVDAPDRRPRHDEHYHEARCRSA